ALVLDGLHGLFLEIDIGPAARLLQLAHLGAQLGRVLGVELAQRSAGAVDDGAEVLACARCGRVSSRSSCEPDQHDCRKCQEPAHAFPALAPSMPRDLWQIVAIVKHMGAKAREGWRAGLGFARISTLSSQIPAAPALSRLPQMQRTAFSLNERSIPRLPFPAGLLIGLAIILAAAGVLYWMGRVPMG